MRATIQFEADVSKVNDIMRSLVLEESNALQDAFIALEKATTDRLVEGISEALDHIYSVANQLEQYRDMVVSFERARFETIIPQPAPVPPSNPGQSKKKFDDFLNRINEEEPDEPQEG